jgi:phage portal protein BeeE
MRKLLARFKATQIVARGGIAAFSWFSNFLAQTRINFSREVGDRWDNGVVQAAVSFFWRNLQYPEIEVQRQVQTDKGRAKWEGLPAHPFVNAIQNGPFYDDSVLWFGTLISWYVAGNAYWLKVFSGSGEVVGYIYIPHIQIRPMADKYNESGTRLITYYEFTPVGGTPVELKVEEVVHFRCGINPRNMMYGLSPIEGALRSLFAENEADTITAALLHNGLVPALGISPKVIEGQVQDISPEQAEKEREKFQRHMHGDMAGIPMYMPFPVEVSKLGFTPAELDLGGQRAIAVSRILACMGFDPMVLGLPSENKTYSNYGEANESAHETNMLPTMMILAKQLTHQTLRADFTGAEELKVGWNLENVRALQPDQDKSYKRNTDAFKGGVLTRKEAKINMGEEYDDERDDVYITDIQAAQAEAAAEREAEAAEREEEDEKKKEKTAKALLASVERRKALEAACEVEG